MMRDLCSFRHRGTATIEAWYPAGQITGGDLGTGASNSINTIYAAPWVEAEGCTLDYMGIRNTNTSGTAVVRLGIYKATSATNLYPGELVKDTGAVGSMAATGAKTIALSPNVTLEPNTLYWFVLLFGTAGVALRRVVPGSGHAIFGVNNAFDSEIQRGLTVAQTYGALPSTFPAGAAVISTGDVPAIFARLAS